MAGERSIERTDRHAATNAGRETSSETAPPIELPPRPASDVVARATGGEQDAGNGGESTRARVALRIAVSEWVVANRMDDLDRLMALYAPTVTVFGSDRDVARAAIRRAKERVLKETAEVSAGEPTVVVAPGGRTASTRLRLRYVGAGQTGSGEVIRELGWVWTPEGWKIASERDVAVIRPSVRR